MEMAELNLTNEELKFLKEEGLEGSNLNETLENIVSKLNKAADAYYNGEEIMSNFDYDRLYDQFASIERKTGIEISNSPTKTVGAEVVDKLPKYTHKYPALSLDKTKDIDEYQRRFAEHNAKEIIVMYKEDGSTVQAYYNNGKLQDLVTRGNGEVGSVITHNARFIKGLPLTIPYKGEVVVRGEAVMSYAEFNRINSLLQDEEKYKNPRNLANATISMLDSREMSKREIWLQAFNLVKIAEDDNPESNSILKREFNARLTKLDDWGFNTVPRYCSNVEALPDVMNAMTEKAKSYGYPVDGLVACMNDYAYTKNLKGTGHNPHIMVGYAYKWSDTTAETTLREIEWSPSRTGLLNPVAVFDPVELEGTTVTRASLHNLSYVADKDLKVGDHITVYKANMIIPQVADNLSTKMRPVSNVKNINSYINITECPVCKGTLGVNESNDTFTLICTNPNCAAKKIGAFVHFAERDCMNIIGLSEETITKFVENGYLETFYDIYHLERFEDEITSMDGFGKKSYDNLINSIENSRNTDFVSFIHACGIPNVGKGQAKLLKKYLDENMEGFKNWYYSDESYDLMGCLVYLVSTKADFTNVEGFGDVISTSLTNWVKENLIDYNDEREIVDVLKELKFTDKEPVKTESTLSGMTFVFTGSLNHFANRDALVAKIEELGGKASGSVSAKTSYLINNDVDSTSGKNKKAKELGVPIISEEDFLKMI